MFIIPLFWSVFAWVFLVVIWYFISLIINKSHLKLPSWFTIGNKILRLIFIIVIFLVQYNVYLYLNTLVSA